MKISTKGRYALRVLAYLAMQEDRGFVSLKEISEAEGISKKYLEQIMPLLNKSGILRTNRGNRGGYQLGISPEECTVGDVLRATEGSLAPVSCLEQPVNFCPRAEKCRTLFVWEGLNKVISEYLDSMTLQDIVNRARNDGNWDGYCI